METSPPMLAIWRTKVAVIGRTMGEAGRKMVWIPGAMASDQDGRPGLLGGIHHQPGKGHAGEPALGLARQRPAGLLQHGQPFFGRKQRRLTGMQADRDHKFVSQPCSVAHHVEVAVGHGVKRPGIKGYSRHLAGLTCPCSPCKAAIPG